METLREQFANKLWQDIQDCEGEIQRGYVDIMAEELINLIPVYEPVELEVLGEEEIVALIKYIPNRITLCKNVSLATISKNQKGQLYRVKEVENRGNNKWKFYLQPLLQAQIAKVKSFYEPVELEALGYTEQQAQFELNFNKNHAITYALGYRDGSRATIKHNQKGQLFRLEEEK